MLISVRDLLRLKGDAVWYVSPETAVMDALNELAEKDIGALLVLESGEIAGILSERDIVRRIAETREFVLDHPVREFMTEDVLTISPSQTIEDCMQLMTDARIRHLPVVEEEQVLA